MVAGKALDQPRHKSGSHGDRRASSTTLHSVEIFISLLRGEKREKKHLRWRQVSALHFTPTSVYLPAHSHPATLTHAHCLSQHYGCRVYEMTAVGRKSVWEGVSVLPNKRDSTSPGVSLSILFHCGFHIGLRKKKKSLDASFLSPEATAGISLSDSFLFPRTVFRGWGVGGYGIFAAN